MLAMCTLFLFTVFLYRKVQLSSYAKCNFRCNTEMCPLLPPPVPTSLVFGTPKVEP